MSKSAAVVLPLVLWLLDDYHNRKPTVRMFIEKIPFLAVSMVFGLVALESQRAAMPETQLVGMGDKILIAAHSLWLYVIKAVFPMGLSAFYPYPPELGKGLPAVYFLAALGVLLILGLLWYSRRWSKTSFMGMGFFGITIALVLQVVTVGNATMADRYTYVPYIGLFFVLGTIWENYRNRSAQGNRLVWNGVAVVALAIMALLAFRRVDVWKDDEALFTDVLDQYPEAQLAYNNRGCCYLRLANVASRKEEFYNKEYLAKAFQDFDRLVQINDQYRSAYHNRGLVRFYLKDYNGAVEDYTRAMAKDTSNKGIYFDRATSRSETGDHAGALQDFDTAIEYRIRLAESFFNRGNTRRKLNDFQGALADYNRAIEAQEDFLEAIQNRSLLHMVLRDYPSALKDLDRILELKPDDQVTVQNRRVIQALVDSIAGKAS
jgi:tetratricopeptide (TPR) repeat protein